MTKSVWLLALCCGCRPSPDLQRLADASGADVVILELRSGELLARTSGAEVPHEVGAAFKPILVAAAWQAGLEPSSALCEGCFTVADLLRRSTSTLSLAVIDRIGLERCASMARALGVALVPDAPPSACTFGVTQAPLLNLTRAYATLLSGRAPSDPALAAQLEELMPAGKRGPGWFLGRSGPRMIGVWKADGGSARPVFDQVADFTR